jgi:hypothetical protein
MCHPLLSSFKIYSIFHNLSISISPCLFEPPSFFTWVWKQPLVSYLVLILLYSTQKPKWYHYSIKFMSTLPSILDNFISIIVKTKALFLKFFTSVYQLYKMCFLWHLCIYIYCTLVIFSLVVNSPSLVPSHPSS